MDITTLGIDVSKNTFHIVGTNRAGKPLYREKFTRQKLAEFVANHPPCLIGMEACAGSQHLARKFEEYGHQVKLMPAQFVKPYLKSNKNDYNDAAAIAEAVRRPTMRFVTTKTTEQHDLQAFEFLVGGRRPTVLFLGLEVLLGEVGGHGTFLRPRVYRKVVGFARSFRGANRRLTFLVSRP